MVNAANIDLSDLGGVAAEIAACGGPAVQRDANAIIARNGELAVTQTALQAGDCLPHAQEIINVVGPRFDVHAVARVERELRTAVYNVLRSARMRCHASVALPLISAGIFGFGAERSARIVLRAVFDFYFYWYSTVHGKHSPAEIEQAVKVSRTFAAGVCRHLKFCTLAVNSSHAQTSFF